MIISEYGKNDMDRRILDQCPLFRGLSDNDTAYALAFFHAREQHCRRGEQLNRTGEMMRNFGLVLTGIIHVSMDDFDGNQLLMASVTPGITFGESLCYLGMEALVSVESVTDSTVLMMDTESLRHPAASQTAMDIELTRRFTAMLAERTLRMNDRIQVLSKLTIREKVITLLSQYTGRENTAVITLPFNREAMATYLGTNQSALSRELRKMKDEGIIRFHGSTFEIL